MLIDYKKANIYQKDGILVLKDVDFLVKSVDQEVVILDCVVETCPV